MLWMHLVAGNMRGVWAAVESSTAVRQSHRLPRAPFQLRPSSVQKRTNARQSSVRKPPV